MKEKLIRLDIAYSDTVGQLLLHLDQYDDATLNQPLKPGGWSALQHLHHLILSEEKSMEYVRKKLHYGGPYPPSGLRQDLRYGLLVGMLSLPIKFKAPPHIGGNPDTLPTYVTLEETKLKWQSIRQEWGVFFATLDPSLSDRAIFRHARAGKLGWSHMLRFYIFHFKRHRKQILRDLGDNNASKP
jgi:hypothetical protein